MLYGAAMAEEEKMEISYDPLVLWVPNHNLPHLQYYTDEPTQWAICALSKSVWGGGSTQYTRCGPGTTEVRGYQVI